MNKSGKNYNLETIRSIIRKVKFPERTIKKIIHFSSINLQK